TQGVDLSRTGSKNIGATNVMRTCGLVPGILAYILDIGKGMIAVLLISLISPGSMRSSALLQLLFLGAYFTPVAGHIFPVFLKFKGGKGVAVTAGILLLLIPVPLLITVLFFLIILIIFRIVSLASVCAAAILPFVFYWQEHYLQSKTWFLSYQTGKQSDYFNYLFAIIIMLSIFIRYKHKSNIILLIKETERSFGRKKQE
ncbi:MAG TPA: glycerol-3-phosphate acyltransferase, partial [Spirochaetota bacterium]|nr:glycerol-3-phosphate acyltransferase [Spirochaetota bacterium]